MHVKSQKCEAVPKGLVFKAHRLLYHSTLGLRVIKKKRRVEARARKGTFQREVPREQKILKGHLPRVMYHQVYQYTKINSIVDVQKPNT